MLDLQQQTALAGSIGNLLQAKNESDRGNYTAKHRIMRNMLQSNPDAFIVDSEQGNIVGITHKDTGFRMHVPKSVLPEKMRAIKYATALSDRLPKTDGGISLDYLRTVAPWTGAATLGAALAGGDAKDRFIGGLAGTAIGTAIYKIKRLKSKNIYNNLTLQDLNVADFSSIKKQSSDDSEPPSLLRPLAISAGTFAAALALGFAARRNLEKSLLETDEIDRRKVKSITAIAGLGNKVHAYDYPIVGNAAYLPPHAVGIHLGTTTAIDPLHSALKSDTTREQKAREHGAIIVGPNMRRAGILAHELGHASIQNTGGLGKINQNVLRPVGDLAHGLGTGLAIRAGYSMNALPAVGLGAGIGLITSLPELINEGQATSRALKYLRESGIGEDNYKNQKKSLRNAYLTYALSRVGIPALTAAGGSLISKSYS